MLQIPVLAVELELLIPGVPHLPSAVLEPEILDIGYADTNYEALRATFGFSDEMMARLARNSVTASFLPEGRKTGLLSEIDA